MGERTRLPLPEPVGEIVGIRATLHGVEFYGYFVDGLHQTEKLRVHTADQLRQYADAENSALSRWKSTNAPRLDALEGLLKHAQIEAAKGAEAIASLESERAANAILTDETAAMRAELELAKQAAEWHSTVCAQALEDHTMLRGQVRALREVLEQITRHFTKAQSTLADTEMRGMAHRVLKDTA